MISFVIPCFNEEGNVKLIYEEIHRVFDAESIPVELVMVNDGSKDETQKRHHDERRDDPCLHALMPPYRLSLPLKASIASCSLSGVKSGQ